MQAEAGARLRAVAYCRVSTDSSDQLNSLENQRQYFEEKLSADPQYELCVTCANNGIYAERGVSGTKLSRPEFDRMLYDAGLDKSLMLNATGDQRAEYRKYGFIRSAVRKPKFDLIMVKDISRFARNVLAEDILRELRAQGVSVYFTQNNLRTDRDGDSLITKVIATIAEQESRDKSVKVRFGVEQGARRGRMGTHPRLYGYEYIQAENRHVIVPEEADVVRRIFEMYADGLGIRRILNQLEEEGIKTRAGKEFVPTTIKNLLANEKYYGKVYRHKWDTGEVFAKVHPRVRDRSDWLEVQGIGDRMPAIIDGALFMKCQTLRSQRNDESGQRGVYKGKTPYSSLIYCGVCGDTYCANMDKGRRFFNCSTKKQRGTKECASRNLQLSELEAALTDERLHALLMEAKILALEIIRQRSSAIEELRREVPTARITELRAALETVQKEGKLLLRAFMRETIPEAEYEEERAEVNRRAEALEKELTALTMPQEEMAAELLSMRAALEQINCLELKAEFTEKERAQMVERITVYPDNLTIKVRLPIEAEHVKMDAVEIRVPTALQSRQARYGQSLYLRG